MECSFYAITVTSVSDFVSMCVRLCIGEQVFVCPSVCLSIRLCGESISICGFGFHVLYLNEKDSCMSFSLCVTSVVVW